MRLFLRPDDRLIVFVSFGGRKYDDSPKAIYLGMLNDRHFDKYRLVWAFMDPDVFDIPRGEKIKIDTIQYFKTILRARIWVTNSSMTRGLSFTGINTFELNTWHGSAIKKMGCDVTNGNKSFGLKGKNGNRGVMLAQGQYDVDVFSSAFKRSEESFRITGLPRNDVLCNVSPERRITLKAKLMIPKEKHVILYAPTFREYEKDAAHNCVLVPPIDLEKWQKVLGDDYIILFRAHYEVAKVMNIIQNEFVRDVSTYPDLNDLMIASDILISDYSSIFFDYSIQGKPMLCFAYDIDRYTRERGLYFDIREYLPFAYEEDNLLSLIKGIDYTGTSISTTNFRDVFVTEYGMATTQSLQLIYDELSDKPVMSGPCKPA